MEDMTMMYPDMKMPKPLLTFPRTIDGRRVGMLTRNIRCVTIKAWNKVNWFCPTCKQEVQNKAQALSIQAF